MKYGKLILEKKEYVFLKRLLNVSGFYKDQTTNEALKSFSEELTNALIYDHEKMPEDVIRLNSLVTIESGDTETVFQVVIPTERNMAENKISILAPLGLAVIGFAQGDTVNGRFTDGSKNLQILSVEQTSCPIKIDVLL